MTNPRNAKTNVPTTDEKTETPAVEETEKVESEVSVLDLSADEMLLIRATLRPVYNAKGEALQNAKRNAGPRQMEVVALRNIIRKLDDAIAKNGTKDADGNVFVFEKL